MATRSKTLALCETAWAAGVPLKVTSDGFPIVMKPSMNCEYKVEGTRDIAYVGFPQDIPRPDLVEKIRAFLLTVPRLTAEEFQTAPDGVYTWILASANGSAPTFYASRTTAMLELGTVHYSIATAVGAATVHGAGEVWKHADRYTFNFLSGTFMEKWDLPKECPLETMQEYLKTKLRAIFPYLFRAKEMEFRESDPTFINSRFLELTTAELEGYVKAGFIVCIHDMANKAVCKSTKSACKKPVTLEQMKGGDVQRIPMTPRKAYLNRASSDEGGPSQAALARQVFASRGLLENPRTPKEIALAALKRPISPGSVGLGRKTKKAKKAHRKTRRRYRGGEDVDPKHVGVRMAESLVGPKAGPPPLLQIFERLKTELKLTDTQVDTMVRAYSEAAEDGVYPEEDEFRRYLIHRFKLKTKA